MVKRDVSRLVVSACCFVLLGSMLCFSTKSVTLRTVKAQSPAQTSGTQSSKTETGSTAAAQQPAQTSSQTSESDRPAI